MMWMEWWIWLLLGLFLLLLEMLTPGGFYTIFFGIGAIVVGVLVALGLAEPLWLQWLLFSVLSVMALVLFRRPLLERMQPVAPPREVDSLVGQTALAVDEIPVGDVGKAELRGASWSARNVGANKLLRGQRCRVERVEGLTLCVRGD